MTVRHLQMPRRKLQERWHLTCFFGNSPYNFSLWEYHNTPSAGNRQEVLNLPLSKIPHYKTPKGQCFTEDKPVFAISGVDFSALSWFFWGEGGLLMWFLSFISLSLFFFFIVSVSMYVSRAAHTPHYTCEDRGTICGEQPRKIKLVHLSWACRERRPKVNLEDSYHTPRKRRGQNCKFDWRFGGKRTRGWARLLWAVGWNERLIRNFSVQP